MSIIVYDPNGTVSQIMEQPKNMSRLAFYQSLVGGLIEVAVDFGNIQVIVNEEGLIKGMDVNRKGHKMVRDQGIQYKRSTEHLHTFFGPVLLVDGKDRLT